MHVFILLNLSFGLIPDIGLDVRKCPCSHTKSSFHTIFGSTEHGWSLLGGHMLCQDSNHLAYADCIPYSSREMDSEHGNFNLECMAEGNYSLSTAILVVLNPNNQGHRAEVHEHVGLIVRWCNGQVGWIDMIFRSSLRMLILNCMGDRHSSDNACTRHSALSWVIMVGPWALPQIHRFAQLICCPLLIRRIWRR